MRENIFTGGYGLGKVSWVMDEGKIESEDFKIGETGVERLGLQ